jgi:hypothetical protein
MSDRKISELVEQTTILDEDLLPFIREEGFNYANYKATKSNFLTDVAKTNITQQFGPFQGSTRVSQNISGSVTIDCSLGNIYDLTLTGNVTNFNVSNLQSGFLTFNIIQTATPYTFAFGTGSSTFKLKKNDVSTVSTIANETTKLSCESNGTIIQYVMGVWVN